MQKTLTYEYLRFLVFAIPIKIAELHDGNNAIFYNLKTSKLEGWLPDTDIEMAERQNKVIFVGYLTKADAMKGGKPDIAEEKERIQLKFGEII